MSAICSDTYQRDHQTVSLHFIRKIKHLAMCRASLTSRSGTLASMVVSPNSAGTPNNPQTLRQIAITATPSVRQRPAPETSSSKCIGCRPPRHIDNPSELMLFTRWSGQRIGAGLIFFRKVRPGSQLHRPDTEAAQIAEVHLANRILQDEGRVRDGETYRRSRRDASLSGVPSPRPGHI